MAAPSDSILDDLLAAWGNAAKRLAEIDATPVDQQVRSMEQAGFVSLDWNAFRDSQWRAVEKARTEYVEARKVVGTGNLFTVTTGNVRG